MSENYDFGEHQPKKSYKAGEKCETMHEFLAIGREGAMKDSNQLRNQNGK